MRSRECGLYEPSDILQGDHLCEKSQTVQWIAADQPHKRKRRLRNHNTLKNLLDIDPDSVNIFNSNLIDDFYPARPAELEDVCLYDFTYNGIDFSGNRSYRKLEKSRLPNHRLYDPTKENERESYYYSLLLLFLPFRDEADLSENNSAEQAFNKFLALHTDMKCHHEKLLKMLNAHSKVTEINSAREKFENTNGDDKTEPEGVDILGEATAAMNDVHDIGSRESNDIELHKRIQMLNADQLRIFKMVSHHLCHQLKHEKGNVLVKASNHYTLS